MVDSLSDSIVINADPDTIMDVIADFDTYTEWQDEIKEVEVLDTDADGWATRVRFKVDAMITEANYVLDYAYTDTSMSWVMVEADKLRSQEGSYELEVATERVPAKAFLRPLYDPDMQRVKA